jgi:hypothetical protein
MRGPWKYGGYLETFRKKYKGGPKLLILEQVIEKSYKFLNAEQEMKKLFDEIDTKGEKDQPDLVSTFHVQEIHGSRHRALRGSGLDGSQLRRITT